MNPRGIPQIIKDNWILLWLLLCVALMPMLFSHRFHRWLAFRQVEREFRSEMDPSKVQVWAANLLAQHLWKPNVHLYPHGGDSNVCYPYPGWSGTNLPPGASNMVQRYGYWPEVEVRSDHVVVFGGGRGRPELHIGLTNFVYHDGAESKMWKPGVYFVIPESIE